MGDNQRYHPNMSSEQTGMDYPINRIHVPNHMNYGHMEAPMHFYSEGNYNMLPPYSHVGKVWHGNERNMGVKMSSKGREFCVVTDNSNQIQWASVQQNYQPVSIAAKGFSQAQIMHEQNPNYFNNNPSNNAFRKPVEVKPNNRPTYQTAVITHTNEYKEMIENHDPSHQSLDKNWNASTRRSESETQAAVNNLNNAINGNENSMNSNPESPHKPTTRSSRMRIFKHGSTQDSSERTNNSQLIKMQLKGNNTVMDGHGPSGDGGSAVDDGNDGEPPVKVQKIAQSSDSSSKQFEKYQISSNVHTLQPKHIISWYLDYLISENEDVTEMSKSFTIPMNIFASDDFYYMESLQKKTHFPSPKFLRWMKVNFPSINVNAIDFQKKGSNNLSVIDPERYWQDKTANDVIKEVFYHFQEERILQ